MSDEAFASFDAFQEFLLTTVAASRSGRVSLDAWRTADPTIYERYAKDRAFGAYDSVGGSKDLDRIVALPRRPQVDLSAGSAIAAALVEVMNERLRRPDRPPGWRGACRCASYGRECVLSLKSAQAWALYEAPLAGGLLGLIAVGAGKTAIGLLMPLVVPGCALAVGLVPKRLQEQLVAEYLLWREHWRVPNLVYDRAKNAGPRGDGFEAGVPTLHIVTYERLSQPESTTLLRDLGPQLLYGDEIQALASMDSARTKRFVRLFASLRAPSNDDADGTQPPTAAIRPLVFCGWSGTLTDKSILEVAHLAAFALNKGSPLPIDPGEAKAWAQAVDPGDRPRGVGELRRLMRPDETLDQALHRRLVETTGVVVTKEGAVATELVLHDRRPPPMPPALYAMLQRLRNEGVRPDGEELVEDLQVQSCAAELALGFYYHWTFPRAARKPSGEVTDEARAAIELWFARRKKWRRELRLKLLQNEEYLDSEKHCTSAAERFLAGYDGELPVWEAEFYEDWLAVKDTVYHETHPVWVDDFAVDDAVAWAQEYRGIVWYAATAFGRRVADRGGFPLHGGGPGAEARIRAEPARTSVLASLDSHGTGRDGLQYKYSHQLLTSPPASGKLLEQYLARLHRPGQRHPVHTWLYRHTPELAGAFDRAVERAEFAQGLWGAEQKVLSCRTTFLLSR